ncbi:MAG: disk-shape morphogenesis protein volactin [Promethearchaeota archaeon]
MCKSLDCGTMFLVKGELDIATEEPEFTVERNCFLQAATTDDTEDTLKENNWTYAKHADSYYILGEDAIKLKNLLTVGTKDDAIIVTKIGELRRPMKNGILNTGEEKLSVAIIQKLIANLIGNPTQPGEVLCFCTPGDPVDKNLSVVFHRTMVMNFLKGLGYSVECIPEALAIVFSQRPVAEDPTEAGGEAPFSGIAFSFGAGMANICFAWKKMPLINFSVAQSGDFIDEQAAKIAGINVSAMTRYKENHLDLNNIDYSDMRQASLDIFYQNTIEHALNNFAEKFNQLDNQIDAPLEIVIAGGTASVPGFIDKFQSVISGLELPFKVKNVRMAENPFFAVSHGCLVKAMATEKKKQAAPATPTPENKQEKPPKRVKLK